LNDSRTKYKDPRSKKQEPNKEDQRRPKKKKEYQIDHAFQYATCRMRLKDFDSILN